MQKALFGAGCFWGIEEYFRQLKGVQNTQVGYSGGEFENPAYEDVCTGKTGHAEVVLIIFNEDQLSYEEIINHFWQCHDPTQLNQQGPDIGTQYRSEIFYYSEEQKKIALNSKKEIQKTTNRPIVTKITEAADFYKAEEYHQCFIKKKSYFKT